MLKSHTYTLTYDLHNLNRHAAYMSAQEETMNTNADIKLATLIAQHECTKHWAPWTWYVQAIRSLTTKKGTV